MKQGNYLSYLMLIGATFFWSTNFILGKFLTAYPPFFIGTARFLVAALVFAPFLWRGRSNLPKGRIWWLILIMGLTGIFIFNPMIYLGLHYTTSINATMINSFTPLIVAVMSHFWLNEQLRKEQIIGLSLSILGIFFIAGQGDLSHLWQLQLNPGDLLIFLSTFVWATYTVLIKLTAKYLTPTQSTGLAILAGLIFLIPATTIQNSFVPLPHVSLPIILVFIYLGVFPSVVSFLLWNTAVHRIGPSLSGIVYNFIPVFNVILATQILHESLHLYHVFGFFLVFAGVFVASGIISWIEDSWLHKA
ncbi:MAG: DMT family transporter [Desulfitobacteriaceae bacterium]